MDEPTRLLNAARAGNRNAFAALVRLTQADVWRFCAYLASAGEADDLTQETYLRAYRSLAGFRGEAGRAWLVGIARHVVADDRRRSDRRARLTLRLGGRARHTGDPAAEIALTALLDELPDDRRTAFVLTQLLGFSYAEAADVCGCEIGTIRSRVSRARSDLVALAEPEEAAE